MMRQKILGYTFMLFLPIACQSGSTNYSIERDVVKEQLFMLNRTGNSSLSLPISKKKEYRFRKYSHVTKLYQRLYKSVVNVCMEHKVPPAAIMSIISLESGWGQGYVGQITGNFMSLNATKSSVALPALYLPKHIPSGKILYDTSLVHKYKAKDIRWEKRPSSLKKDYRPAGIAGTMSQLTYFKYRPKELTQANLNNVRDFVSRFISSNSRIKAYREARMLLDKEILAKGENILFDIELNKRFIHTIGGKPSSFNYRETWPKKVLNIMSGVGAVELSRELYLNKKSFEEVW